MTIKWKCNLRWGDFITPVEVVAETKCFVTVRERGFRLDGRDRYYESKIKKDGTIFDTFEEAKAALVDDAKMRVTHAEARWQQEKDRLKKCNDFKKPSECKPSTA